MAGDAKRGDGGFTDREMRLIFERAGEITAEEGERRYSLAEIKDIAEQAGLDPRAVTKAAASVRVAPPVTKGVLGAPARFTDSRYLELQLSDDAVNRVVVKIREATGFHGELRVVPGGVEWRVRHSLGATIADFVREGTGTRASLTLARDDAAAVAVIGGGLTALLTGLGAAVALFPSLGPIGAVSAGGVAGLAIGWGGMRLIWTRMARRYSRQTAEVMQTIADAAVETTDADA